MLIYVLDILLVLLQVFGIQASGQYFKLNKTWFEATKECDLAMPKVNFGSVEFDTDIQGHVDLVGNDLWVGYFKMKTGFEYIGCSVKPFTTADVRFLQNTPGLCQKACTRTAIVGISGNECFCLDEEPPRNNAECNLSCESDDGILCGGHKLMSVYRSNKEVTLKEVAEGTHSRRNCLSFQYYHGEPKEFTWESCSGYHLPLCNTTNQLIDDNTNYRWNESVQYCLRRSLRPSNYKDLQDITGTINPSWSGIIRSDVMYTYKDFKDTYTNVWYGYLTTDEKTSEVILKFTNDGADKEKVAFCQSKRFGEDNSEDQSSSTGVIVGVSVAVVLIIIAVISTIVILKRRQKIPAFCRGFAKNKEPVYTSSNSTTATKPNVKTAFDNHDYFVASKKSNYGDKNRNENTDHDRTYFVHDQPVNVTVPVTNTNIENESDYNEITLDINATYDHADNKTKNGEQKSEHTYDTTKTAAIKKEIADSNPDNFGDTGEDAYNHINGQPLKSSKTDNVYGVSKQHKNFTEDAGRSLDKDIHDAEDTYNHINENLLKSNGTDNVYGLSSN